MIPPDALEDVFAAAAGVMGEAGNDNNDMGMPGQMPGLGEFLLNADDVADAPNGDNTPEPEILDDEEEEETEDEDEEDITVSPDLASECEPRPISCF